MWSNMEFKQHSVKGGIKKSISDLLYCKFINHENQWNIRINEYGIINEYHIIVMAGGGGGSIGWVWRGTHRSQSYNSVNWWKLSPYLMKTFPLFVAISLPGQGGGRGGGAEDWRATIVSIGGPTVRGPDSPNRESGLYTSLFTYIFCVTKVHWSLVTDIMVLYLYITLFLCYWVSLRQAMGLKQNLQSTFISLHGQHTVAKTNG